MSEEFIKMFQKELIKQADNSISKEIIEIAYKRINDLRGIIETGEIAIIISFIYMLLSNTNGSVEEKTKTLQLFIDSLVSSICLVMVPITGSEQVSKIFAKYREKMYLEIVYTLNNNLISALEEVKSLEGNTNFVFPTTTIH